RWMQGDWEGETSVVFKVIMTEKRMEKCNQDVLGYVEEFRDFSKMVLSRLAGLNTAKAELKREVENLLTRLEHAQRDIEYFGSVTDSNACVEVHEGLVEQQLLEEAEEKKRLKLMLNASCDHVLAGIKSLKIVKKTGEKHGSWMKDPGKKHAKIYLLSGSVNNVVLEFSSIMAFMENNQTLKARRVPLPWPWQGTGHAIYQGFLFYHSRNTHPHKHSLFNIQLSHITSRLFLIMGLPEYFHENPTFLIPIAVQTTVDPASTLAAAKYSFLSASSCHFSIFLSMSLCVRRNVPR
uniref:Olfactomedin like 1 n=1 Tax=Malurus cyaneus samueli TaxID=2593467 RepID=A0A8C5THS6_9PASS